MTRLEKVAREMRYNTHDPGREVAGSETRCSGVPSRSPAPRDAMIRHLEPGVPLTADGTPMVRSDCGYGWADPNCTRCSGTGIGAECLACDECFLGDENLISDADHCPLRTDSEREELNGWFDDVARSFTHTPTTP